MTQLIKDLHRLVQGLKPESSFIFTLYLTSELSKLIREDPCQNEHIQLIIEALHQNKSPISKIQMKSANYA